MGSPLLALIAVIAGVILFAIGVLYLPICAGQSFVFFGMGIFCIGAGVALVGGLLVFVPTSFLAALLVIAGFIVGHGASGCGF